MKMVFCLLLNIKDFFKLMLDVARHAQITQNNKFANSLQYIEKKVNDEGDLLQAYKYESFL